MIRTFKPLKIEPKLRKHLQWLSARIDGRIIYFGSECQAITWSYDHEYLAILGQGCRHVS